METLLTEVVTAVADSIAIVQELLRDHLAMSDPYWPDHRNVVADRVLPSTEKQRAKVIEVVIPAHLTP